MCRNIKVLHNFKPPATEEEIRASSIQFVRKLSGFTKPSKANEAVFNRAVDQVAQDQAGPDGGKLVDIAHQQEARGRGQGAQEVGHQEHIDHGSLVDHQEIALERF